MDKKESLSILNSVCKQIETMSETQLFDYMIENSDTFKNNISSFEILFDFNKDFIESSLENEK